MSRDVYQTKIDGHDVTVAPGGRDSDGIFVLSCEEPLTMAVGVAKKFGHPTEEELQKAWRVFFGQPVRELAEE